MSIILKWLIALVVIAGLVWLAWWSGWFGTPRVASQESTTASTTSAATEPRNGMSPSSDTSNAALEQDATAIDAQMGAYASDSAAVDSSLNDQPISQ